MNKQYEKNVFVTNTESKQTVYTAQLYSDL